MVESLRTTQNVFDSHARDMYHNSQSEGTCIVGNTIRA